VVSIVVTQARLRGTIYFVATFDKIDEDSSGTTVTTVSDEAELLKHLPGACKAHV